MSKNKKDECLEFDDVRYVVPTTRLLVNWPGDDNHYDVMWFAICKKVPYINDIKCVVDKGPIGETIIPCVLDRATQRVVWAHTLHKDINSFRYRAAL